MQKAESVDDRLIGGSHLYELEKSRFHKINFFTNHFSVRGTSAPLQFQSAVHTERCSAFGRGELGLGQKCHPVAPRQLLIHDASDLLS